MIAVEVLTALARPGVDGVLATADTVDTDFPMLIALRRASTEFVNMTMKIDRLPEAARVLGYLQTSGLSGAMSSGALVADAAARIAANPEYTADQDLGRQLDRRHALLYMRGVLERLLAPAATDHELI